MAPRNNGAAKKSTMNKGAWTAEEDKNLSQYIELHGAKRWTTLAIKSGLNRCGKSCRLRWLNYLRPNIKRGNISDDEEDLIVRLHKLLGNRWSLIAGRLPGRTDNEIKNYWNSHLSKKINGKEKKEQSSGAVESASPLKMLEPAKIDENEESGNTLKNPDFDFEVNNLVDFTTEESYGLEWVSKFLNLQEDNGWMKEQK
ncbi:hypothetical protein SAY87_000052 [Trapa incisa]|uniref:Myb-related protein 123 n=1 Tax=Trapa incisa TaxID=236973 RepID=A0AAN7GER5_9MYRT|nr:hypothetical protein SAY87_000052 [Trapa incisa]